MVNSFERPHSSAFGAYSVTSHQRIQGLRLTQPPLQLFSSCIVASFVPHSRDYGAPGAAYDARGKPTIGQSLGTGSRSCVRRFR